MSSRTVRVRLDEASQQALATLVREGRNESEAVRTALIEAARHRRRRSAHVEEARRLAEDPVDSAERQAVMEDMRRSRRTGPGEPECLPHPLPWSRAGAARPRYAVVVQADELLGLSTVVVAPTSRSAASATFRPEVEVAGEPTRILVEQLRAVDLQRLGKPAGRLTAGELRHVDDALELILGL